MGACGLASSSLSVRTVADFFFQLTYWGDLERMYGYGCNQAAIQCLAGRPFINELQPTNYNMLAGLFSVPTVPRRMLVILFSFRMQNRNCSLWPSRCGTANDDCGTASTGCYVAGLTAGPKQSGDSATKFSLSWCVLINADDQYCCSIAFFHTV